MTQVNDRVLGHSPIGSRPNIRNEVRRIYADPLARFLTLAGHDSPTFVSSDCSRYADAYRFYALSMERYLTAMSVAARYSRRLHWKRRSRERFTKSEQALASKYRASARFLELDVSNCLIHTRILLDRTISLSRLFLKGSKNVPSFTSFTDHKKFFAKLSVPYGAHEEYARLIREETNWYEMPVQVARDKYTVHASPRHSRFLGYPNDFELDLCILVPDDPHGDKPLASVKVVVVNALRMSIDIEQFLEKFASLGEAALGRST
jgi:hypothetical protein